MRHLLIPLAATALVATTGCATIKAAVKGKIREKAHKATDRVVERVLDRLEVSPEARSEVEAAAKKIAREEIDRLLSDEEIDAANEE